MVRAPEAEVIEAEQPRRRAPGGAWVTFLLGGVSALFLGWAGLRFAGLEINAVTTALIALTQYAIPVGAVLTVVALLLRRWLTVVVVGVVTAILAATVAPRVLADNVAPAAGRPVTVMSLNTYFGEADAEQIVRLVRRHDVDILSLQELTPKAVNKLGQAGLYEVLPHRVFATGPVAEGSGIASRYPLRELSLMPRTQMEQPSVLVDLPGPSDMQFVAVHPIVPVGDNTTARWKHEIGALPSPTDGSEHPVRVLAGDFNATLDHTPLRQLLGQGYEDAAEVTGEGLQPTWPMRGRPWAPPVTLDHVLVSGDISVTDYRTVTIDGTDHRAVLARLVVPK